MLLFAAVGATACTTTSAAVLDTSVRLAPTCPDAVKLYTAPGAVGAEYTEVALLNTRGSSEYTSDARIVQSMRKKAAAIGANGVIVGNISDPGTGEKVAHRVLGTSAQRKGKAVAVFVPSDSVRASQACASVPK